MSEQRFPPGWDADRVKLLIEHYDSMTEEERVAEDEDAVEEKSGQTVITIPDELLPSIRQMLGDAKSS